LAADTIFIADVILRVDLTLLIRFLRSLRLGIYRSFDDPLARVAVG
jgi:hypothetical protein